MMIWQKTLCIALGMAGGLALVEICSRCFRLIVRHLVARRMRLERAARKRLDITQILEERK